MIRIEMSRERNLKFVKDIVHDHDLIIALLDCGSVVLFTHCFDLQPLSVFIVILLFCYFPYACAMLQRFACPRSLVTRRNMYTFFYNLQRKRFFFFVAGVFKPKCRSSYI